MLILQLITFSILAIIGYVLGKLIGLKIKNERSAKRKFYLFIQIFILTSFFVYAFLFGDDPKTGASNFFELELYLKILIPISTGCIIGILKKHLTYDKPL